MERKSSSEKGVPELAVHSSRPIAAVVAEAAPRLGCCACEQVGPLTLAAIIDIDSDVDAAANAAREALSQGASCVIGVASVKAVDLRLAYFDAGAADVVEPEVTAEELVRRLERLAVLRSWSRSLQRMMAESSHEAEHQRALFQAVIDTWPVSIHAIDRNFKIVVWNRGREEGPFGRPRGEALGEDLFDVIGDDSELREQYREVFRLGQSRVDELTARHHDPPRLFRVEKLPMRVGNGDEVSHVITLAREVTQERARERSLAQTEKMAAVGRLAAGIAHEIKNPLATIAGCAEAMRDRLATPLADDDRREVLEDAVVIEGEAYRCKEILEGILDFSRSAPSRPERTDPGVLVRQATRLLRHHPKMEQVQINFDIAPNLPEALINADQVKQALMVLLLNAADAAPQGTVTIRVRAAQGQRVAIAVEDEGPGVPTSIRERIFEPFFTTKPTGQGTGLGLAVAYGIVQAHGGELNLAPSHGRGARFEIVLPALSEVTT